MDSSNKQFKKEMLLLKEKNYVQLSQVDKISRSLVVISLYYCVINIGKGIACVKEEKCKLLNCKSTNYTEWMDRLEKWMNGYMNGSMYYKQLTLINKIFIFIILFLNIINLCKRLKINPEEVLTLKNQIKVSITDITMYKSYTICRQIV